jgi:hypothetical protein
MSGNHGDTDGIKLGGEHKKAFGSFKAMFEKSAESANGSTMSPEGHYKAQKKVASMHGNAYSRESIKTRGNIKSVAMSAQDALVKAQGKLQSDVGYKKEALGALGNVKSVAMSMRDLEVKEQMEAQSTVAYKKKAEEGMHTVHSVAFGIAEERAKASGDLASKTKYEKEAKDSLARCAFLDRKLHSRMPLVPTPAHLKRAGV